MLLQNLNFDDQYRIWFSGIQRGLLFYPTPDLRPSGDRYDKQSDLLCSGRMEVYAGRCLLGVCGLCFYSLLACLLVLSRRMVGEVEYVITVGIK